MTTTAGPVVAYNILALLAPALAAWGCFMLCRGLTGEFRPALAGGYVFGFSTYVLAVSSRATSTWPSSLSCRWPCTWWCGT